jgi:hypothetical protein
MAVGEAVESSRPTELASVAAIPFNEFRGIASERSTTHPSSARNPRKRASQGALFRLRALPAGLRHLREPLVALSPQRCPLNAGTELLNVGFCVEGRDFTSCRNYMMRLQAT